MYHTSHNLQRHWIVDEKKDDGYTALHLAALNNHAEVWDDLTLSLFCVVIGRRLSHILDLSSIILDSSHNVFVKGGRNAGENWSLQHGHNQR